MIPILWVCMTLLVCVILCFVILITETRAIGRQQKMLDRLLAKPASMHVTAMDKITRQRGQYMIYLQARLEKHGIAFEQEAEWMDNHELRQFEQVMQHY